LAGQFGRFHNAKAPKVVRFDKPPHFSFAQAAANSKILFEAEKGAGVGRIVHISITKPDRRSELPYFRGKAELESTSKWRADQPVYHRLRSGRMMPAISAGFGACPQMIFLPDRLNARSELSPESRFAVAKTAITECFR
jgi:hypothetical protein